MKLLRKLFKRHKHSFDTIVVIQGIEFIKCECGLHELSPDQEAKDKKQFDELIESIDKFKRNHDTQTMA